MAFNLFWPNAKKHIIIHLEYGVYKRYDYEDVDIFMMDNRMFKTALNQSEQFFGDNQMNHFINEIMGSSLFLGNSILTREDDEPFQDYSKEYEVHEKTYLSRINGVVFILETQIKQN